MLYIQENNFHTYFKVVTGQKFNKMFTQWWRVICSVSYNEAGNPEPTSTRVFYNNSYAERKWTLCQNELNINNETKTLHFSTERRSILHFSHGTFIRYKDYCKDETKTLLTIPPDSFVKFVRSMKELFYYRNYLNCEILKSLTWGIYSNFLNALQCMQMQKNIYKDVNLLQFINRTFRHRRIIARYFQWQIYNILVRMTLKLNYFPFYLFHSQQ